MTFDIRIKDIQILISQMHLSYYSITKFLFLYNTFHVTIAQYLHAVVLASSFTNKI